MIKQLLAHRWLAPAFWIILALLVKGLFFSWYLTRTYSHDVPGFLGQSNGDMMTYIMPAEHYLAHGDFATDDRMPGYPMFYLILRRMMDKADACNAVIFIQLLVSAISVYFMGLVARRFFRSERAFYWAYFIYLFSTFVSVFDAYFLTESLAAAATIFFLHAWLRVDNKRGWLPLLASGAWLTWSIFLKPAHLPLLAIPIGIWGLQWLKGQLPGVKLIRYSLLFLLPFLVVDGLWTARNYRNYHEVIPLLKNPWYAASFWPPNYFDMMAFCQTYGEDYSYWFPNAGVRWIMGWQNNQFPQPIRWYADEQLGPPPAYVYTSRFNQDSIAHLRYLNSECGNNYTTLDSVGRAAYYAEIHQKLLIYTQSVKDEKPFVYYGVALGRYAFTFFNGDAGYSFLDDIVQAQWPRWLLRWYYYLLVLLPGLLGFILMTIKGLRSDPRLLVAPLAVLMCTLIYVVILRHPETRYLAPFYPFLILGAVYTFLNLPMPKFAR